MSPSPVETFHAELAPEHHPFPDHVLKYMPFRVVHRRLDHDPHQQPQHLHRGRRLELHSSPYRYRYLDLFIFLISQNGLNDNSTIFEMHNWHSRRRRNPA